MNEKILKTLHDQHRPKDNYYIQTVYTFTNSIDLKGYGKDYALALVEFQQKVRDFDTHYKGHVVLIKNNSKNEIIRVNL